MPFHHFISFTAINIWSGMSITCLIHVASVVFLAVLQPVTVKTIQGSKCLFLCLPTDIVSAKKSQASAIFIDKENGGVHNHSGKTYHLLCINKLHVVLTWPVTFTSIVPTCCNVFPIDVQVATFGVTS